MSQSGSIRIVKGLKFAGYDQQNNELCFQGTLGTTKYIFDTEACKRYFGVNFGSVTEFMLDPTSPAFDASNHLSSSSSSTSAADAALRPKTFKDFLGRFFMPIGVMISPQEAVDAVMAENGDSNKPSAAPADGTPSASEETEATVLNNRLPLYAIDVNDMTLICLNEATNERILNARYPLRIIEKSDHGLFDAFHPGIPFGFTTTTLYGKYFVKEGEQVYLANLQDSATIIGEAFGCVWVALESKKGKIVPLPKATDEARLVTLYGLSDISNAPRPGTASYEQQTPISPRQIQTPRGNDGSRSGPPFVLGKKSADGKSAVLCNCPMNQTVLAVCTADALKPFEVKPMGRIFFALGVDAGKSATILGVKNGSLYIHVDGAPKCICLRNATNAQELRERYTGSDGKSTSSQTSHYMSPSQTMPKKIDGPVPQPSTLSATNEASSSSPLGSIPRLSLGRLGSTLSSGNNSGQISPHPRDTHTNQQISPVPQKGRSTLSPSSQPAKGFYYWTANGCLKFDISAESCSHFGVRHAQTHRFTSGPDAGSLFHIVGVHAGNLYVVQDHKQLAVPLRYCSNETDVKNRVGPSLISTTKLRSADPRGQAPSIHPMRSPDRRAGSPFGLSPRNYQPEPGEDVGEWGKEVPKRERTSYHQHHQDTSRDLGFTQQQSENFGGNNNNTNNNLASGTFSMIQRNSSNNMMTTQKSMSPSGNSNGHLDAQNNSNNNNNFLSQEFSVSIGRSNRGKGGQSLSTHPLDHSSTTHGMTTTGTERSESNATSSHAGGALNSTDSIVRNTRIPAPKPVRHEPFKVGHMPATRLYLKAIALRALGVKRDADMPTAFFRFFSHDAGQNLSRALQELPKFQAYWDQREKPMRGGRSFQEATCDMMVEALENLAQLRGEN